jgi:signal transduction histidine kinase
MLPFFAELLDPSRRRQGAIALARHLGGDDVILFVRDHELDVLLPALGFPQTLPRGRLMRALVSAAVSAGHAEGEVARCDDGSPVRALACRGRDGSVMVLLGGTPALSEVIEACRYLPFVAAPLRLEWSATKAEEHALAAQQAAEQARALAQSLDDARRQLQRAFSEAESAHGRAAFMAEAATLLGSSLDYETTLEEVARLSVRFLADWCFVDLVGEGQPLHRLAVAHADPAHARLAAALRAETKLDDRAPEIMRTVLRSAQPALMEDVSELDLHGLVSSEHLPDAEPLRISSGMCVPLVARGRSLGTLLFLATTSARRYDQSDLALATAIAGRAALAVDNARLYRDAQDAIRARNDFLSMAAHELRTPLTPVQLQLASLERMLTKEGTSSLTREKMRAKLSNAVRQTDRMAALIDNLLDISRLTVGRLDLHVETVDLSAVVQEVVARFNEHLQAARCELTIRTPGVVEGRWDRLRLDQIVTNHLTNAMKYGQGRPIEIEVRATIDTVWLSVRDQGIGISTENQARIFRQFERAVTADNYSGFGLGLWIVAQIIEAMEGSIDVVSEIGHGSTFTVKLPRWTSTSIEAERALLRSDAGSQGG